MLGEPAPLKSQIFASGETAPKSAHPFLSELMKTGAAYADPKLPQKLDSTVPVEELKSLNLKAESMGGAAKLPVEAEGEKSSPGSTALSPGSSALEKIMDQGMRMFPFEDDEMTACVRMEPQDIGLLPMPYWRLAGNSFLLHGYYRYRHLIMARKKDGTFVFGVPVWMMSGSGLWLTCLVSPDLNRCGPMQRGRGSLGIGIWSWKSHCPRPGR